MSESDLKTVIEWIEGLRLAVLNGNALSREDGLRLLALAPEYQDVLLAAADELRRAHSGNRVKTCSIINAKSGRCSENCRFCAQSAHHATTIEDYPLMNADEMLERATREEHHSLRCGIVTAGRGIKPEELETVCEAISDVSQAGPAAGAMRVPGHFEQC